IDRCGSPLVTECLKHIRRPACRTELRQSLVCAAVSLCRQRLSQELLHGRIIALEKYRLKLNDGLDDAIRLESAFRWKHIGILQCCKGGHRRTNWSGWSGPTARHLSPDRIARSHDEPTEKNTQRHLAGQFYM